MFESQDDQSDYAYNNNYIYQKWSRGAQKKDHRRSHIKILDEEENSQIAGNSDLRTFSDYSRLTRPKGSYFDDRPSYSFHERSWIMNMKYQVI